MFQFDWFQAIWCNMIGIKPLSAGEWTEAMNDNIYDAIDQYGGDLFLHTISMDKSVKCKITDINIRYHDVVLLAVDGKEQININDMVVDLKLADYDSKTKNKMQNVPNIFDEDSDEDWDDEIDVNRETNWINDLASRAIPEPCQGEVIGIIDNIDDKECFEFFKDLFLTGNARSTPTPTPTPTRTLNRIEEINEIEEQEEDQSNKTPNVEPDNVTEDTVTTSSSEGASNAHQLVYIYNRPKVHWWQTEEMLLLRISAHENVKYGLEITPDCLIYG